MKLFACSITKREDLIRSVVNKQKKREQVKCLLPQKIPGICSAQIVQGKQDFLLDFFPDFIPFLLRERDKADTF